MGLKNLKSRYLQVFPRFWGRIHLLSFPASQGCSLVASTTIFKGSKLWPGPFQPLTFWSLEKSIKARMQVTHLLWQEKSINAVKDASTTLGEVSILFLLVYLFMYPWIHHLFDFLRCRWLSYHSYFPYFAFFLSLSFFPQQMNASSQATWLGLEQSNKRACTWFLLSSELTIYKKNPDNEMSLHNKTGRNDKSS